MWGWCDGWDENCFFVNPDYRAAVSDFLDGLAAAAAGPGGMTTGEPGAPVRTSWADLQAAARKAAAVLVRAGVRPGDAVAILAGAPAEVALAAQAVWLAGGSVTMLHQPTARTRPEHYARETLTILRVISARVVVVGPPFDELREQLAGQGIATVSCAELRSGAAAGSADPVARSADDPALLQLTSGSTATPKAVRITHGNLWANLESMCAGADLRAGRDVMVSWLPLFHDMGMVGFVTMPMARGLDTVLVSPADFLRRPLLWPELISRYRGTATAAPNFAYALTARVLAKAEESLDLSSMRFLLNGAEPIDIAAVNAFLAAGERFGLSPVSMVGAYGMAEATLGVSFHPWGTPVRVDTVDAAALESDRVARPTTDGRTFAVLGPPLGGIEVRVVQPDGSVRGDREVGVLQLRGTSITSTYLTVDGPVSTRTADGWLDTGDLGYLIDGNVVVCGRVKDVIIMGGRNILPTDIERAAESVPGVRAGNAVAVSWTASGGRESFAVLVESRSDDQHLADAVRSAVTTAVGVRPAQVQVLPPGTLPKTPSGKLQRTAARALLSTG